MSDERLRASLRGASDEHRLHRNWGAIEARRGARPPRARRATAIAGAIGIAAAAIAVVLVLARPQPPGPGPLRAASGDALVVAPGHDVVLADGSRVAADAESELDLLENDATALRWWLRTGRARFDVTPGGPRRWVVETGAVVVEVLGTAFTVAHVDGGVQVDVERGTVLVRGVDVPGGLQRLEAGASLTVITTRPRDVEPVVATPTPDPSVVAATEAPPRTARPRIARDRPAPSTSSPIEPAEEPPVATAPPADLRSADALRAQGRVAEAAALLDEIARSPSESSEDRALAAFTLARLALDRLGRPSDAADAFALALDLGLDATLIEVARARRVEALARAGDVEAASEAAREYVRHHPAGRWRHQVERWVAR